MSQPPMGNGVNDRRTPPELFKRYDDRYHFTIDAAASHKNALCGRYCTVDGMCDRGQWFEGLDGLTYPWRGEVVWVNPPYGRGLLSPFVVKAHREAVDNRVPTVMLLPVRTEQPWFQEIVWPDVESGLATIEWVRGRVKFDGLAAAPFPSMIVIWGRA